MRKRTALFVYIFFIISGLHLFAQLTFSGLLDSSVSLRAGAGDTPTFSYGIEEYANIRMQAKVRDSAVFYGAMNFIAVAGDYAAAAAQAGSGAMVKYPGFSPSALSAGDNYIAGIELERLYLRLNGEAIDFDGGLLRLPFGYSQVWGSSDFLNPRNPLIPDARPRAILATAFSWYPKDELKLLAFGAAPRNPLLSEGEGVIAGIAMDQHWDRASLQLLYSFETPHSNQGIHRVGISMKADVEVGLVMDALYTYNNEAQTKLDGLSFSFGIDYSFFDGDLIVLAEYLYNGRTSSTAYNYGGSFSNNHYLYTGLTWRFNDFTNMSAALISCFDDVSFTPVVSLNHDFFQGVTLTVSAQVPLDRDLFHNNGRRGELGPIPPDELQPKDPDTGALLMRMGRYFDLSAKVRLRF